MASGSVIGARYRRLQLDGSGAPGLRVQVDGERLGAQSTKDRRQQCPTQPTTSSASQIPQVPTGRLSASHRTVVSSKKKVSELILDERVADHEHAKVISVGHTSSLSTSGHW